MSQQTQQTYHAKKGEVARKWFVVDLDGKTLGRAATRIADVLRGKNKPQYTPSTDTGDFVIVLNASRLKLTGDKLAKKEYHSYSGYPGGLKTITAEKLMIKRPEAVVKRAVRGMLPKSIMGKDVLKKLKIYPGKDHPHAAQKPEELKI